MSNVKLASWLCAYIKRYCCPLNIGLAWKLTDAGNRKRTGTNSRTKKFGLSQGSASGVDVKPQIMHKRCSIETITHEANRCVLHPTGWLANNVK